MLYEPIEWGVCQPFEPGPRRVGRFAGQHESGQVATARRQLLVRVEQPGHVLARLESSEKQHIAVGRRVVARRPRRGARRAYRDSIGRQIEVMLDLPGGEL